MSATIARWRCDQQTDFQKHDRVPPVGSTLMWHTVECLWRCCVAPRLVRLVRLRLSPSSLLRRFRTVGIAPLWLFNSRRQPLTLLAKCTVVFVLPNV